MLPAGGHQLHQGRDSQIRGLYVHAGRDTLADDAHGAVGVAHGVFGAGSGTGARIAFWYREEAVENRRCGGPVPQRGSKGYMNAISCSRGARNRRREDARRCPDVFIERCFALGYLQDADGELDVAMPTNSFLGLWLAFRQHHDI